MNSYTGNRSQPTPSSASFDSYQFDFGLASAGRSSGSRPLRDQKSAAPSRTPDTTTSSSSWSYQQSSNKPSWNHQPAAATATVNSGVGRSGSFTNAPASMVGDIFGKSWASAAPQSSSSGAGLGIPKSDPKLFSDLVGSALGRGSTSVGGAPLKSAAPMAAFSMGNLSDSLTKSTSSVTSGPTATSGASMWPGASGSADTLGNFTSFKQSGTNISTAPISSGGGQSMKSMAGGTRMNANKDPFGSLMDFGSKPSAKASMLSSAHSSNMSGGDGDFFGAFQNANSTKKDDAGMQGHNFKTPTPPPPVQQPAPASKTASVAPAATDPIDMFFSSSAASAAPAAADPIDMFFSSSDASAAPATSASEMNDWDLGSEFMGDDSSGPTNLDGLPPPPAGINASSAKTKGMDNYKQGQFSDAIKWLSWAVTLLEKSSGDSESMHEVLSCRASCYKEVGEYKKAVADCSKVLEHDSTNVAILVQRALLYESMEKYRLGAEDLRMVLKIDPSNRLARSTIHRLNKFAE